MGTSMGICDYPTISTTIDGLLHTVAIALVVWLILRDALRIHQAAKRRREEDKLWRQATDKAHKARNGNDY
uniref:Uncharacterized protein n=1 Tax=viral metagenome TaxID=1070528 RepID=A0A6M3L861_9ZZZZ